MGVILLCAAKKCGHAHAPTVRTEGKQIKKACSRCSCKEFKA